MAKNHVSDPVRKLTKKAARVVGLREIARQTGNDPSVIKRFIDGKGMRLEAFDRVCAYLRVEIH